MRSLRIIALSTLVLFAIALDASAKSLFIPVAGRVTGANGTFFRTDVRLFNPSYSKDIDISVHFIPRGMDGRNISGRLVHVPKRQMVVLNDVVGTLFEMYGYIGALWLDSDADYSYNFTAESRTYTDSSAGTLGQFIPAFDPARLVKKTVVTHVASTFWYRTNAGVMNPSWQPAQVTASLVKADGTLLTPEVTFTVPPMGMVQESLAVMFGTDRQVEDGFILFDSSEPVVTWASVLDNVSNDAIFVVGVEDKDEVGPID